MGCVETLSLYFRGVHAVTKMSWEASRRIRNHLFLLTLLFHNYGATSYGWRHCKMISFSAEICFTEDQPPWPSTLWIIIDISLKIWPQNITRSTQKGYSIFSELWPWLFYCLLKSLQTAHVQTLLRSQRESNKGLPENSKGLHFFSLFPLKSLNDLLPRGYLSRIFHSLY